MRDRVLEEFFRRERVGYAEVLVGLDEGPVGNGARVKKTNSEPGDTHQDGALGTVVGALLIFPEPVRRELKKRNIHGVDCVYWVVWDDCPGVPVAITNKRIQKVDIQERDRRAR